MLLDIDGTRYPVKQIEDLELRHIAQIQHELSTDERLQQVTNLRTLAQIKKAWGHWGSLPERQRAEAEDGLFLTCFTVWAARVIAGEDLTLIDAISVPMRSLHWIEEPSDRRAGEGEGKARAPRGSTSGRGKRRKRKSR